MQQLMINTKATRGIIAPEIYGHFSEHLGRCIYGGIYVGEQSDIPNVNGMRTDVVEALKELSIPVLRWPGGCFAEEYNWRDGIGPKSERKTIVNNIWGGVTEDNSFGTHEYMELCRQLGCKTYVNGSVSYATPRETGEWVEYMTFDGISPMADLRAANGHPQPWRVDYFGVGNENWGNGGHMNPDFYGNLYRQYQTYVRSYDEDHPIQKICCGANVDDYEWTEEVLKTCFRRNEEEDHGFMDLLSLHYYVHPEGWKIKGSATDFDTEGWYKTMSKALYMDTLIRRHSAIMDRFDPEKKVGLSVDEWGTWFQVEPGTNPGFLYQQNTVRDALVAGITLNVFNKHCDRVRLACLAQVVNVLQAVILTEGAQMLRTPTYHVMHMYRHHQGANLLESTLTGVGKVGVGNWQVPAVTESVSEKDGILTVTLNNLSEQEAEPLEIRLAQGGGLEVAEASIVTGERSAINTFDDPDHVAEQPFTGYTERAASLSVILPARSVVLLRLRQKV
ncbi:MAG: alpha-N-arabinofuranosidase [Candidatus Onthomonas sp.]